MNSDMDTKPWYRHLWPWLLMLPPLASVIGGIVTLILAGGPPELVDRQPPAPSAIIQPEPTEGD